MSALFGLLDLEGGPADRSDLARLSRALDVFGAAETCRLDGPVGLGMRGREACPEPREDWAGLCLAAARLDDPEGLAEALGLAAAAGRARDDASLVAAAWARWGEACVDRLCGDWAFAAWDPASRRLVLARDQHGNTGLAWHAGSRRLAFATTPAALLALPDVPRRPDQLRLAQMLVAWPGDGVRTFFEGLQALPPGHFLVADGRSITVRRYWFPEAAEPFQFRRDSEYPEAFLEVYERAVASRLRGAGPQVAATLSGGFDSGSVVALAGPLLAAEGRRLEAYTAVPRLDVTGLWPESVAPNEWLLASATARQAGVAAHLPIKAPRGGLLASVHRQVEIHGAPGHGVANYHWLLPLLDLAKQRGASVLLTGQQGNATVSFPGEPSWFWSSLGRGAFGEAWRALARAEPDPWLALKRQVLRRPLKGPLEAWRRRRALRREDWLAESALAPSLSRALDLGRRMAEAGHDPTFASPGPSLALALLLPGRNEGGAVWQILAEQAGLEVRDPTADRRLVEFCLRVPPSQWRRRGQDRWLLRRAFRDRLPAALLGQAPRGLQASDLAGRVIEERDAFREALSDLEACPAARECLDLPKLKTLLDGLDPSRAWASYDEAGCILLRGISAGMFLRQYF